ncbi:MAG: hypothetical protein PHG02_04605 [Oscillospiraceae bacterium]|nr:hypothetical protein [Oscillospiraceae bacterium]
MKQNNTTKWHKLDNTANIFPVVANKRMPNVFRLTAVLKEEIDPVLLQQALEETLPWFAAFGVRMKQGVFWSYLETNKAVPRVQEEKECPCRYIDPFQNRKFLFKLLYYQNRVHLEVFHVLSDGTGGMRFLKAICYKYIQLAHSEAFTKQQLATTYGLVGADNTDDGYMKNYVPRAGANFKEPTALHIKGEKLPVDETNVLSGLIHVEQLKAVCKAKEASVTEYITACIIYGVYTEYATETSRHPISIFIPVNLRRFFGTDTSLNFFSNIMVSVPVTGCGLQFENVLAQVKQQFAQKLTREALEKKLAYTAGTEKKLAVRLTPLPIKNMIMRFVFSRSRNGATLTLSNLGVQAVEPIFEPYFEGFRFLLSTNTKEPIKITAGSYKNQMALCFNSLVSENRLAKAVFRILAKEGISVTVESNGGFHEKM